MDDFDRDIHNAFHGRALPGAPASLAQTLDSLPRRQARSSTGPIRLVLGLAATLAVLLAAAFALTAGSPSLPPAVSPNPSLPAVIGPSTEPSASVAPSASVEPSAPPTAAPTPTIEPTAPPPTPKPAVSVGPAAMIDLDHGWAVGDGRLLLTSDGGASWRDATPPAPTQGGFPANLLNVQFIDPDHGWVGFAEPFKEDTDPGFGRIDVWRTTNGGQTWAKAELPKAKINNDGDVLGPFSFDFLDATHGYAFLSGNYAHLISDSDLYWTADGGKTWSADRPTGPGANGVEGSSISFASATDGVIVGTPGGSGISVTHDGGKTWTDATASLLTSFGGDTRIFSQPIFFDARTGLLSVRFQNDADSVTRVYRTSDGGSSWTYVMPIPGSGPLFVAIVDQQHWIAIDGTHAVHTQNGGTSWTQLATQPALVGLQAISFVDLKHGWAQWTDTLGNSHLASTSDDGASWQPLTP